MYSCVHNLSYLDRRLSVPNSGRIGKKESIVVYKKMYEELFGLTNYKTHCLSQ